MPTLIVYLALLVAVLTNVSGCRPMVDKPVMVSTGTLTYSGFVACYGVMEFGNGRKGLVIVARSKGRATVVPELAQEGVARIDINRSITIYPLSSEDITHSRVLSYYERAMEERSKTLNASPQETGGDGDIGGASAAKRDVHGGGKQREVPKNRVSAGEQGGE